MGCLLLLFTLITPRFVIVLLWIFSDYLAMAYGSWFWPTLGFFALPTTTIAYAVARNDLSTSTGAIEAGGVVVIVLGVVIDIGLLRGGTWTRQREA